jgi:beta-galactosidase
MLSTESFQSTLFADWQAVHSQPYVVGDFVWSALDYLGEAGIGRVFPPGEEVREHWIGDHFPWHGAYCGDLDVTGWRKPISHYRNIVWNRGEELYAAVREPAPNGGEWGLTKWSLPPSLPSWTWPGEEGKPLTLDVFSRCDRVQVYLNGQLVGEKPTTEAEEFRAEFSVDYQPGELKIVGLRGGEEAAVQSLATAQQASALRFGVDRSALTADGQDLAFVTVEVVDGAGRLCPQSDLEIQYIIAGPGVIAAVGSGDLTSQQSYQANPRRSFQGRALVVVRAAKTPGTNTLTAQAQNMSPVTTKITTLAATP